MFTILRWPEKYKRIIKTLIPASSFGVSGFVFPCVVRKVQRRDHRCDGVCGHPQRSAVREYYITEDIGWYSEREKWKNLRSFGMVHKRVEKADGTKEEEYRY